MLNKKKTLLKMLLGMYLTLGSVYPAYSQVTIGSNLTPKKGALLDLQEYSPTASNANANQGLVLPRVQLTDENNLYPMFETAPASGMPNDNYTTTKKSVEDARHTGLMVYNLNECDGFAKGVYIWNGIKWVQVTKNEGLLGSEILLNDETIMPSVNTIIHIPSGYDKRTFSASQNMKVSWRPNVLTTSVSTTATSGGGISFSSNPPSGWVSPLAGNPTNYTYGVNTMSTAQYITRPSNEWSIPYNFNPFHSRENALDFSTSVDVCGGSVTRRIILNQTNYALGVDHSMTQYWYNGTYDNYKYNSANLRHLITIKDPANVNPDFLWFRTTSNAQWEVTYKQETGDILDNIDVNGTLITDGNSTLGGQEKIDGTVGFTWVYPTRSNSTVDNHYKTAGTLTFADNRIYSDNTPTGVDRFDPLVLTLIQCTSKFATGSIQSGDGIAEASWGTQVLSHSYKGTTFYSADFGNAGRWMITNLAVKSFDTNEGSGNLELYNGNSTDIKANSRRAYGYPRYIHVDNPQTSDTIRLVTNWGEPAALYPQRDNPWYEQEGLLYTWYAATNQNESNLPDQGQQGTLSNTPGTNEIENTGKYGIAPKKYIQGICPNGWHLPSDREWNLLERELYNNPKTYSVYPDDLLSTFNPQQWDESFGTKYGFRGANSWDNHGYAGILKEICPVKDFGTAYLVYSYGYSKEPADGGFNAMCVGWAMGPYQHTFGGSARFWASSGSYDYALGRNLSYDHGYVMRLSADKHYMYSVRCKKND